MKIIYILLAFTISSFAQMELKLIEEFVAARYGFYKINDSTFITVEENHLKPRNVFVSKTEDYGKTWRRLIDFDPTDINNDLFSIRNAFLLDSNTLYLTFDSGEYIMAVKDGGERFEVFDGFDFGLREEPIIMLDTLNGFAGKSHGLNFTNDGWKTWEYFENDTLIQTNLFKQKNDSIFYTVVFVRGATNPDIDERNCFCEFNFLTFAPNGDIFIGGDKELPGDEYPTDRIYKSSDGGKTWNVVLDNYIDKARDLYDMAMRDDKYGVAAGAPSNPEGKIYETYDGGESWERVLYDRKFGQFVVDVEFAGDRCLIGSYPDGMLLWTEIDTKVVAPEVENLHVFNHGESLRIRHEEGILDIAIFDLSGNKKHEQSIRSNDYIDISNFSFGAYVFHILQGGAVVRSGKFLIQ